MTKITIDTIFKTFEDTYHETVRLTDDELRIGYWRKPTAAQIKFFDEWFDTELIRFDDDDCGWLYYLKIKNTK